MATAKLDIGRELAAVDTRNYNFYDKLTPEEQKVFSPFMLMRFTSNSSGDRAIQEWFIETTNEYVNKNFMSLSKNHKALQWKLYAATGIGTPIKKLFLISSFSLSLLCTLNLASRNAEQAI